MVQCRRQCEHVALLRCAGSAAWHWSVLLFCAVEYMLAVSRVIT